MRILESCKVFVLGILLFFVSISVFYALGAKWFEPLQNKYGLDRVSKQRRKFWKSVFLVAVFLTLILAVQCVFFTADFTTKNWFQIAGAFIALVAALGRGGWDIQTYDGKTVPERIDRGMFVISQLGATCILLFVLMF